jgi:hypothetical protein
MSWSGSLVQSEPYDVKYGIQMIQVSPAPTIDVVRKQVTAAKQAAIDLVDSGALGIPEASNISVTISGHGGGRGEGVAQTCSVSVTLKPAPLTPYKE